MAAVAAVAWVLRANVSAALPLPTQIIPVLLAVKVASEVMAAGAATAVMAAAAAMALTASPNPSTRASPVPQPSSLTPSSLRNPLLPSAISYVATPKSPLLSPMPIPSRPTSGPLA